MFKKISIIPVFRTALLCLLFTVWQTPLFGQVYPVEVMPLVAPPYPALLADYASDNLTVQRMQVNLLMRDLSQANRRVRLKVYIEGPGISVAGSDMPQGVEPLFLDGGILLRLTNAQLAPYFKLENLPGLSPQIYARPLFSGLYTFGFEVYDFATNNRLSAKRLAPVQIVYNLPPLLNLPATGSEVSSAFPQNVMFNWAPRHMDISNTEYEFSLVELNDPILSGEAAFMNTPPFYQQTTMASALVYGPAMPPLVQGKRYAWRVQVKPRVGATYTPVFENDGYSPVFTFTCEAATPAPINLTATPRERYTALATWQGQQGHTSYVLELRQKPGQEGGHSNWYKYTVNDTQFLFKNLRPGYTYECRVTGYRNEHNYATSETAEFTTPAMNPPKFEGCGTTAQTETITNRTPLEHLLVGDVFTANQTPVTVTTIKQSSGGAFSGYGWMNLPFLGNLRIAVKFADIMVNTDYQLIAGVVETTYDPNEKNIINVNKAVKQITNQVKGIVEGGNDAGREASAYDQTNITIELNLSQTSQAQYDPATGKLTVSDGQTTQTYQVKPGADGKYPETLAVQDSHGDIYKVDPQTGKVSPMGTPQNPAGIAAEKGKTGVVSFANAPGSKYAIDLFDAAYDGPFNDKSMETINMANGETYRVAAKLMVQGGPDDVVLATVKAPGQFDPDKLVFKTFTGEVWEAKRQAGTMNFLVTIKPGNPNGATTLMALYNSGQGEPELLGKLKVYTYAPVSKTVVLVPVGGASIPSGLASELADSYKKYGITLNIITEPYPEFTGEITTEGITRLSRYSTSMRALNSQFRLWATQKGTFKNDAQYLFFFKASPSGGGLEGASLLGDMPRGKQFGYLFGNANAHVAAHELGHGIFRLAHTFDSSYGYPENSTVNLMDYKGGKDLVKYQWDILHDTGIAGWLDDSEDAAIVLDSDMPSDSIIQVIDKIRNANKNKQTILNISKYAASKGMKKGLNLNELTLEYTDIRTLGGKVNTTDAGLYINPKEITMVECENPKGESGYFAKMTLPRYKPKSGSTEYEKVSENGVILYVKAKQAPRLKEYLLNQPVKKIEFPCEKCGRELTIDFARLNEIFPRNTSLTATQATLFNNALKKGKFNTCTMHTHFFSQVYVETGEFKKFIEDGAYSLDGALDLHSEKADVQKVFMKQSFFDDNTHLSYFYTRALKNDTVNGDYIGLNYKTYTKGSNSIRIPTGNPNSKKIEGNEKGIYTRYDAPKDERVSILERMFDVIYSQTNGNNGISSKDGSKYRGRGAIHLTGREVYRGTSTQANQLFSDEGQTFDWETNYENVSSLDKDRIYSAVAYFHYRYKIIKQYQDGINKINNQTSPQVTYDVNGGDNKKTEREAQFNRISDIYQLSKCKLSNE